jgi:hypothetical protein
MTSPDAIRLADVMNEAQRAGRRNASANLEPVVQGEVYDAAIARGLSEEDAIAVGKAAGRAVRLWEERCSRADEQRRAKARRDDEKLRG